MLIVGCYLALKQSHRRMVPRSRFPTAWTTSDFYESVITRHSIIGNPLFEKISQALEPQQPSQPILPCLLATRFVSFPIASLAVFVAVFG